MIVCVCMCVCVRVREMRLPVQSEREREKERKGVRAFLLSSSPLCESAATLFFVSSEHTTIITSTRFVTDTLLFVLRRLFDRL